MTSSPHESRRDFLTRSTQGLTAMGTVAAWGSLSLPSSSVASEKPRSPVERPDVFATHAKRARKIAVGPKDQIFVAADQEVLVFNAQGQKQNSLPLPRPARCLAVAGDGRLYVGLIDRVHVFDAKLKEVSVSKRFSEKTIFSGIAISEKHLFLADAGQHVIWRCDLQARMEYVFYGKNGFASPAEFFSIELGTDGNVRVVNSARHRVESYRSDGTFVSTWGERSRTLEGFGGCCNPVSLAPLSNGAFITAERGQPRVKLY
ncbi:MAG: hypothetical protein KDA84_10445, partial [Planctomycetaceae bacterium]|nr:hypothetical protein [Planctomycetaceae bacterium]